MICAINRNLMAQGWRNRSAPTLNVAYREKGNGAECAITPFLLAQHWRNGAEKAEAMTTEERIK
jgi:hypothetical protein